MKVKITKVQSDVERRIAALNKRGLTVTTGVAVFLANKGSPHSTPFSGATLSEALGHAERWLKLVGPKELLARK